MTPPPLNLLISLSTRVSYAAKSFHGRRINCFHPSFSFDNLTAHASPSNQTGSDLLKMDTKRTPSPDEHRATTAPPPYHPGTASEGPAAATGVALPPDAAITSPPGSEIPGNANNRPSTAHPPSGAAVTSSYVSPPPMTTTETTSSLARQNATGIPEGKGPARYYALHPREADEEYWASLEQQPGCCFADSGGCCFASRGACCFADRGACCFADHRACCFSDWGGCCFSKDGGVCGGAGCGGNPCR